MSQHVWSFDATLWVNETKLRQCVPLRGPGCCKYSDSVKPTGNKEGGKLPLCSAGEPRGWMRKQAGFPTFPVPYSFLYGGQVLMGGHWKMRSQGEVVASNTSSCAPAISFEVSPDLILQVALSVGVPAKARENWGAVAMPYSIVV